MNLKKLKIASAVVALIFAANSAFAGPPASIEQLGWMTGNWAGMLGPNQLEENWISTEGSSLAAMVRMTDGEATSMFEMITIEEVDGSLVLHIQQWDPGFQPRSDAPQKMELEEITMNSVFRRWYGNTWLQPSGCGIIHHPCWPAKWGCFRSTIEEAQHLEVDLIKILKRGI